jgi:hypothetical protein
LLATVAVSLSVLVASPTATVGAEPSDLLTVNVESDSFIRQLAKDTNEGANALLRVREDGLASSLVAFDLSGIDVTSVESASLVLTVERGPSFGDIDVSAHTLLEEFTQGNGSNSLIPWREWTRGSGAGVTWRCATDTDVSDFGRDCSDAWNGGDYRSEATDTAIVERDAQGAVTWDVTAAVQDGAASWMLRSDAHGIDRVDFHSAESPEATTTPDVVPRLLLDLRDEPTVAVEFLPGLAPPDDAALGEPYVYIVTVTNLTDEDVEVDVFHDPEGLDFTWNRECVGPPEPGCSGFLPEQAGPIDETIPLAPNQSKNYFVLATVSGGVDPGGQIDYEFSADGVTASALTTVLAPIIDFAVTKTGPTEVSPGDPIVYEIGFEYVGNGARAEEVRITDDFPDELTLQSTTLFGCSFPPRPVLPPGLVFSACVLPPVEDLDQTFEDVGAGAFLSVGFVGTVDDDVAVGSTISNTVTVTWIDVDGVEQSASATATTDVVEPDVEVTFTAPPPEEVAPDLPYRYDVEVTNNLDEAVTLDVLHDPVGVDFTWTRECIPPPGLACVGNIPPRAGPLSESIELQPGESKTYFVLATVDAGIPPGAQLDHIFLAGDRTATSATVIVAPIVEYAVTKTATAQVAPGGDISYEIGVEYLGNTSDDDGFRLLDAFPDAVTVQATSIEVCDVPVPPVLPGNIFARSCPDVAPGDLDYPLDEIEPGTQVTFLVTSTVDADFAGSELENTATVSWSDAAGVARTASSTATTEIASP